VNIARVAAVVVSLALAVLVLADVGNPVRPWTAVIFFCFVPGLALFGWTWTSPSALGVAVCLATSLALDLLVAMIMVNVGWSPRVGICALALCSSLLVSFQLWRQRQRQSLRAVRG
jgi:phosphatidylserine synthase